jgi:hypothetical protein
MAVVYRNGRPYVYKSVRRDGRVTSEYRGSGEIAALVGALDQIETAERDSEREEARAERDEMEAAERILVAYFGQVTVESATGFKILPSGQ